MASIFVASSNFGHRALVRGMLLLLIMNAATSAAAMDWPQEIVADEVTIVVYQPQPDKLKGNVLSARAAMSLEADNLDEPIFGAFWFDAKIDTDRDAGTAMIRDVRITNVRWPDSSDANEQRFTAVVEAAVPASGFEISLERLTASLESAEVERESLEQIKNDPPIIEFRESLAVLLIYDGEPRYSDVDNSDYERVLNTPFVVVRKKRSDEYWLSSGKFWYSASNPMGPWTPTSSPPPDLAQMVQSAEVDGEQPESPPAVVAANQPTELIVTQGTPDWQSLPGGEVLYVQNTETPWLRDLPTGNMYVLLSGRWFRAKSKEGPWTFVRADELPASFADIPPASDIGGLRASVAGTDEAQEAVLDAQIPQTAAIKRDEATLTVEYDGAPSFEDIPGTSVAYAVNTGAQVLEIDNRYYAVDNGVWFTSASATGPWAVADAIPAEEIDKIPPSSPVYNTTHVHIYESTPEVVYVGYTPGYLWSFPYYGVPIYGTGWYYPPYYGRWYYPRPPTWGFHVGYNPWTGWNFGMSWTNGFFTFGMSWGGGWGGAYRPWGCCGGWYGGGYRGPVVINTGDINIGNNVNIGNRTNIGNRIDRDTNRNLDRARTNIYNRPEARDRLADSDLASRELQRARPATSRDNNVFADRDGNVARKVGDDWQTRGNGQWNRADAGASARDRAAGVDQQRARSTATTRAQSFDRSSLDRASHSRQVGASRQMARPTAMRGGGGGRRRR
jgi:hypothetical protein